LTFEGLFTVETPTVSRQAHEREEARWTNQTAWDFKYHFVSYASADDERVHATEAALELEGRDSVLGAKNQRVSGSLVDSKIVPLIALH